MRRATRGAEAAEADSARAARRERDLQRPTIKAFGYRMKGLLPEEIANFYATVNAHREKASTPAPRRLAAVLRKTA
jgi:hypothetical protein